MRLVPIEPPLRPGQYVWCYRCGRWVTEAKADLDGPAFTAYYCPGCERDYEVSVGRVAREG